MNADQQSTTADPIADACPTEGVLKRTVSGKLVICVNAFWVGRQCSVGEILTVMDEAERITTPGRAFRVTGKGQPFMNGWATGAKRRAAEQQYVYVEEIGARPSEGCARCGRPSRELMTSPRGPVCSDCYDDAEA